MNAQSIKTALPSPFPARLSAWLNRNLQIPALSSSRESLVGVVYVLVMIYALAQILALAFVYINNLNFPLNLELMEGNVLQHVQRLAAGQFIYPQATADYIPLAYNPLYYVVALPFTWLLGSNLATLRMVAIVGVICTGLLMYRAVHEQTQSRWWAVVSVGLLAAAHRVLDSYLHTAHADSWLIGCALLGSYLIGRDRSRAGNLAGMLVLIIGFWFKQHGAIFVVGGLLYLTWRDGLLKSIPHWLLAAVLGGVAYILLGPLVFGPYFHYFTWQVPSGWSQFGFGALRRYIEFILLNYAALIAVAVPAVLWSLWRERRSINVWYFQLPFALLTGLMGSLDPGSSNNVFIPMGVWVILTGVLGAYWLAKRLPIVQQYHLYLIIPVIAFAFFFYNPLSQAVSADAPARYDELMTTLNDLNGQVFAPDLGYFQRGYDLYPAVTWVALQDMIRGKGRDERNNPLIMGLLEPLTRPDKPSYLLLNHTIDENGMLGFLADHYVLQEDFGDRFAALTALPHRFEVGWPRYLYVYAGD